MCHSYTRWSYFIQSKDSSADVDYAIVEWLPRFKITSNDKLKPLLEFYLFNFCTCLFTSENFGFEKKFSNMVQTLQRNLVEKMYFDIVFNLSLHHVGEFEPCQTRFNIFTLFLSPSWRHGSKIFDIFSSGLANQTTDFEGVQSNLQSKINYRSNNTRLEMKSNVKNYRIKVFQGCNIHNSFLLSTIDRLMSKIW